VRYVYYYGRSILEPEKRDYFNKTLILEKIVFKGVPDMSNGTSIPAFVIRQGPEKVLIYKSPWYEVSAARTGGFWSRLV
jgi:phosphatidylinositol-3,4,5-trisphosphate 3-phosphatase/dual-specificity protein phosphatase PTEN